MEMLNAGLLEAIVVDDWKAQHVGAGAAEDQVNEGAVRAHRRAGRLGDPQGQPEAAARCSTSSTSTASRSRASINAALQQYTQAIKQLKDPTGAGRLEALPGHARAVREVRREVRLRPADARRAGLPGVAAQPGREEPRRRDRRHAGDAGHRRRAEGGRHPVAEPNIHAGAKYMDQLMTKYFPDAKFDEVNRTLFAFASYNAGPGNIARMRKEAGEARPRPRQVVQQRRDRHGREDRHRDDDLRAQHLQVLRLLQADARRPGGAAEGPRAGRARDEMTPTSRIALRVRGATPAGQSTRAPDARTIFPHFS